jgi:hypothetical protein
MVYINNHYLSPDPRVNFKALYKTFLQTGHVYKNYKIRCPAHSLDTPEKIEGPVSAHLKRLTLRSILLFGYPILTPLTTKMNMTLTNGERVHTYIDSP